MILIIFLLVVSSAAKAVMDALAHTHNNGWDNKWKLDKSNQLVYAQNAPWYYLGLYRPKYIERFPYSSTLLVFLATPWHRAQFVCHTAWQIALVWGLGGPWWGLAVLKIGYNALFLLVYDPLKTCLWKKK